MKLKISQRHFINDEETLKRFKGIVDRTIDAKGKMPDADYSVIFSSKYDGPFRKIGHELEKLNGEGVNVVLGDYGPGDAWFRAMTDVIGLRSFHSNKQFLEHPKGCVTALVDGDQFNINDDAVLDGIYKMSKDLVGTDLLLALGARDKVSLADTEELDNARKIEEMYHAFFMGYIQVRNPLGVDNSDAPNSYKIYGDPIPGCYLINNTCSAYPEWYNILLEDSSKAVLTRKVGLGDTIGVMNASVLNDVIPSIYIPTRGNPPGPFKLDTIKEKSVEMGKTGVGVPYLEEVLKEENKEILNEYYPEQNVEEVRSLVRDGLLTSIEPKYLV